MVGLCATMKYGTICARYIEALSWQKWVAICVAETYIFFFCVLLLPFCSRHVFLCYFANLLVSFFLILDVFQSEMWTEFFAAIPDHLQPLVSRVQETVLASRADGTIRTYLDV